MPKAIRMHTTGGPEVLVWEEVPSRPPGPGEIRLRQTAIGVNYIDVYHRNGLYPLPEMPAILGREAAGTVVDVGPGVEDFSPGDRVAYPLAGSAYAEERTLAADQVVLLPDTLSDVEAAASLLKGLTAHYLLRRTYEVRRGDTILVHAAAGGVGLLLCQWAKALGAIVIGTVGSEAKAELARAHGCDHAILYSRENFVRRVRDITAGAGVPVVYDSVGKDTFEGSLDCLAPLGILVSFGQASGTVPPFNIGTLASKGSLFLTRPTLHTYISNRQDLLQNARELFGVLLDGTVRVEVRQSYPLADAARAHRDLESRGTIGSSVLMP